MAAYKSIIKQLIISAFLVMGLVMGFASIAFAAQDLYEFNEQQQEQRYHKLLLNIRCAVCQNQSLADSHTELAEDLRREIYHMIITNKSDEDIQIFLVERYGQNILYEPPMQNNTIILWIAPLFLLLFGFCIWVWRRGSK